MSFQVVVGDDYIEVRHIVIKKNGTFKEDQYRIMLSNISYCVFLSIKKHGTFPFEIPHSHKIFENGVLKLDRALSDWVSHAVSIERESKRKVAPFTCDCCNSQFFSFEKESRCCGCRRIGPSKDADKATEIISKVQMVLLHFCESDFEEEIKKLKKEWDSYGLTSNTEIEDLKRTFFDIYHGAIRKLEKLKAKRRNKKYRREWREEKRLEECEC